MKLGIDFGTTRTGVAIADRGNYPVVTFTTDQGDELDHYPTAIAERGGELVTGIDVGLGRARPPGTTVLRSFKRLLSDPNATLDTSVVVGRSVFPLVELVAAFLRGLKRDLATCGNLPAGFDPSGPVEAYVATPANAHSTQRLLTLEAFRRAGFVVKGMVNEPSAAGIEFAHRHARALSAKREKIAVFDLGGGTFDASLVDLGDDGHRVLASGGVAHLGGDDFDQVLLELAVRAAGLDVRQLALHSRDALLDHCRALKESLHPNTTRVLVELGAHLDQDDRTIAGLDEDAAITLKTADYYEACGPLVAQTIDVLQRVIDGQSTDDELAAVYVVGGASSLPAVGRALRQIYGRRIRRSPYPAAATAMGLAIAADGGATVSERLSRHFGVFREACDGREVAFDPIFDESTSVPEDLGAPLTQVRTYRPRHNVGHFRFVECGDLDASGAPSGDITPLPPLLFPFDPELRAERGSLAKVPIRRLRQEGPPIEETYAVDAHGIVSVQIRDLDSGYTQSARLQPAL